ncbi:MAG: hypothetical protein MUE59_00130 [Thiobacillaceae bacterium]|jgi:hypothetical protein|nr:hypothetical protein [Thiobacillaceae bacterium]
MADIIPEGWQALEAAGAAQREIDFAIVNPAGNLLLIEQKSGCIRPLPQSSANHLFGGQIKSSSLACFWIRR